MTHEADFRRVTEHGSEFFRVTCRETGHTAMHWNSYLKEGHRLTIAEDPPGGESSCFCSVEHVNARKKEP